MKNGMFVIWSVGIHIGLLVFTINNLSLNPSVDSNKQNLSSIELTQAPHPALPEKTIAKKPLVKKNTLVTKKRTPLKTKKTKRKAVNKTARLAKKTPTKKKLDTQLPEKEETKTVTSEVAPKNITNHSSDNDNELKVVVADIPKPSHTKLQPSTTLNSSLLDTEAGLSATEESLPIQNPNLEATKLPLKNIVQGNATTAEPHNFATANSNNSAVSIGVRDARNLKQKSNNLPPIYPMLARKQKKQGTTVLMAYVSKTGNVGNLKIHKSSGSRDLDAVSFRAFARYRFSEGQEGWVRMPFNFQLKGNPKAIPGLLMTN